MFVYFLLFVDLDYHLLLNRNTKYLVTCLILQHSNNIWLAFCNDIHLKCQSNLFKYFSKKCSHNRKQFMFDTFCYSQPTSKYVLSLKERHINWIFIYFFIKSALLVNPMFLWKIIDGYQISMWFYLKNTRGVSNFNVILT